jgi:hypothetical protein
MRLIKLVPSHPLALENNTSDNVCQLPVRLHGELSAAALQTSQDKPLALWYALRAINTSGSGVLDYGRAITTLSAYAYTPGTARRHLREGRGTFWTIENTPDGRTNIRLFSLLRLCQHFKVARLSWPCMVRGEDFRGLRKRRASLYASWMAHHANPIQRSKIEDLTRIPRRTQQAYEKIAKINTVKLHAFIQQGDSEPQPIKVLVKGKDREYWMDKRLPNQYVTKVQRASIGMAYRINIKLRQIRQKLGGSFQVHADNEATTRPMRIYFKNKGKAVAASPPMMDPLRPVWYPKRIKHYGRSWVQWIPSHPLGMAVC